MILIAVVYFSLRISLKKKSRPDQVGWALSRKVKGPWFESQLRHIYAWVASLAPVQGVYKRQPINVSLPLSYPPFHSL